MLKKNQKKSYSQKFTDFNALKLTLASPDQIKVWSHGEVTKAETINYRTYRPEPDGIFCEKIFGPSNNFECYCGKYKKVRFKGIVCDKCGVEVTTKDVRRERMGHINLAVPVVHLWYAYSIPSKISIVLNIPQKKLLSVIYYARYMVVKVEEEAREATLKKAEELLATERATLSEELEAALSATTEEFSGEPKKSKAKSKDKDAKGTKEDFKQSQVEHKKNQALARIRMEFAQREEDLEHFYNKMFALLQNLQVGSILTEDEHLDLSDRSLVFYDAQMGADAIEELLNQLNIDEEVSRLRVEIKNMKSQTAKMLMIRRLQYLEGFQKNSIDPTWMILKALPVLPPDLRPIIPLSGGKFAAADLNDLYRRVINRNNRLQRLINIGAPDVILRNEKRMLQEAVDALIDNSHKPGKPMVNSKKLPYKSLTDELRGKKGIFRRNLLGKRVDYSGRSVIIGEARLKLDECGLPKPVALEIFKPFVIKRLIDDGVAANIRIAKDYIDAGNDRVWDILEDIIKTKTVLLNRAPTLHKYSIQAFRPVLVSGDAIRIHPLVCQAFNADFDGDQMAVHVLLTDNALEEGRDKMLATKNLIKIADGSILTLPRKEMLLGYFLLTDMDESKEAKIFGTDEEVVKGFQRGVLAANDPIIVKTKDGKMTTTAGRIIFNEMLPADYAFVNKRVGDAEVNEIVRDIIDRYPTEVVVQLFDDLKSLGFKYSSLLGFSFSMEDCRVDYDIKNKIKEIEAKDEQLQESYMQGLLTYAEKVKLSTKMWEEFTDEAAEESWKSLDKNNPVYEMVTSKADGGKIQARQIMSIKGLIRGSSGDWIALPIKGNYRDGLDAFEYFLAANGGRKGVADTALRTSASGYLTRRLCDVAHDVIIRMEDCGYEGPGLAINRTQKRRVSFKNTVKGRVLAQDLVDSYGHTLAKRNTVIDRDLADKIEDLEIQEIHVRTPLLCKAPLGMCKHCYGWNIERSEMIDDGAAVGIIAAQSIGEPGTQLTMRTFHVGAASKTDITQGLPRIDELLEARTPKFEAEIAKVNGKVSIERMDDGSAVVKISGTKDMEKSHVVSGAKKVSVADGEQVKAGQVLYIDSAGNEKAALFDAVVTVDHGVLTYKGTVAAEEMITVLPGYGVLVNDGDMVVAGTQITEGSVDPKKLAEIAGLLAAQKYVLDGVQSIFNEQGIAINDLHLEVIIRQMAKLAVVLHPGDTEILMGSLVNRFTTLQRNEELRLAGKEIIYAQPKLLGIKTTALKTESFLSAMSFQEQVKVLTESAITGRVDQLRGMKENVMIGRKIPTGKDAMIDKVVEEIVADMAEDIAKS